MCEHRLCLAQSAEATFAALRRTIEAVHALGKKVVLIAPPPSSDFDIGACLERRLSGAIAFGGRPGCLIDRAQYRLITEGAN